MKKQIQKAIMTRAAEKVFHDLRAAVYKQLPENAAIDLFNTGVLLKTDTIRRHYPRLETAIKAAIMAYITKM